jgi:hypothetical protein
MGDKKEAEKKLDGQRKAIEEHIKKFRTFQFPQDKEFALKTIRNAQKQIEDIKKRNPLTSTSPFDTWKPY